MTVVSVMLVLVLLVTVALIVFGDLKQALRRNGPLRYHGGCLVREESIRVSTNQLSANSKYQCWYSTHSALHDLSPLYSACLGEYYSSGFLFSNYVRTPSLPISATAGEC